MAAPTYTYTIDTCDADDNRIWQTVATETQTQTDGETLQDMADETLTNWIADQESEGNDTTGWRVRVWAGTETDEDPDAEAAAWPDTDALDARRAVAAAEAELTGWAAVNSTRDELFRRAAESGVTKSRISELTGVARTTIDRIPGMPTRNTTR